MDSKCLFSDHVDYITTKAYRGLGFVIRSCKPFTDISAIKSVYYAYVRSVLEYASPVWSPNYLIYKHRLENIQKTFINHLNYRQRYSVNTYLDGCRKNNIPTLEERRILLDMGFLYDLMLGRVDCGSLVGSVTYRAPRRRTRHTPLLHVPPHATNYASNEPLTRAAATYNKLFSEIDMFHNSKDTFKRLIIHKLLNTIK